MDTGKTHTTNDTSGGIDLSTNVDTSTKSDTDAGTNGAISIAAIRTIFSPLENYGRALHLYEYYLQFCKLSIFDRKMQALHHSSRNTDGSASREASGENDAEAAGDSTITTVIPANMLNRP
uniref:Aluminum-activated malate transporter 12 n=1 Tax=Lygus hesperus TaxID=30085 RepID=A0A0A9XRQ4_LYGHE